MRKKNKSANACDSGAPDPKPMRLVGTEDFNVPHDKWAGSDMQDRGGAS
jgi:hypothetical protein